MKKYFLFFAGAVFFLSLFGCAEEDPQVRIRNERIDKANVQLQTTGGNTVNINDVGSGAVSGYLTVASGNAVATAVIQNVSVSPTVSFMCNMDEKYTVVILNDSIPSLRVDH
jgi:hypothetical protein